MVIILYEIGKILEEIADITSDNAKRIFNIK